ncbi:MAG TPA: VCBS repeat-containing protein, partial [Candidatus Doudnabacteria bacterium]|nr:VCBS repeat-containing protein [Candidatus Doudnabacteria bacterium]
GRTIVRTYDNRGQLMIDFFAYGDVLRSGVDVAAADFDGDGIDEIVTAPGPGGGPHIKVFKANGSLVSEFMAYNAGFRGGVRVAAADIDGDGIAEIITAPWSTGGPHVKVFDSKGNLKTELMAYSAGFFGGVDVAAFPPEGSFPGGFATAPGPGGGPHIKVFSAAGQLASEFMAYAPSFTGGVRIDAGNPIVGNASFEIVTGPASNSSAQTKIFKTNGELIQTSFTGFEQLWTGGTSVAIVGREVFIASYGGRQTAVRKVTF